MQQHLASADPTVAVTGTFDAATDTALRNFQAARGLAGHRHHGRPHLAGAARPAREARGLVALYINIFPDRVRSISLRTPGTRVTGPIRWSRGHAAGSNEFWKTRFSARAPKP